MSNQEELSNSSRNITSDERIIRDFRKTIAILPTITFVLFGCLAGLPYYIFGLTKIECHMTQCFSIAILILLITVGGIISYLISFFSTLILVNKKTREIITQIGNKEKFTEQKIVFIIILGMNVLFLGAPVEMIMKYNFIYHPRDISYFYVTLILAILASIAILLTKKPFEMIKNYNKQKFVLITPFIMIIDLISWTVLLAAKDILYYKVTGLTLAVKVLEWAGVVGQAMFGLLGLLLVMEVMIRTRKREALIHE
ncbi:MAG: hypothetical protein FK730_09345 [Asgard group archaeon]|nr:hypothetical protein [Asgard group archaeon]